MSNKTIIATSVLAVAFLANIAFAKPSQNNVMTKRADGTYIVNTTTLCPDVKGYRGATPLEIHIKKNKVTKVVPLKNRETPSYFQKVVNGLMNRWEGMKVSKAEKAEFDGVTGATFSSKAVKENIKAGLKYYNTHK